MDREHRARRIRWLSLGALFAGLAVVMPMAPRWPKEQTVHYVLGDAAPRLQEISARWAPGTEGATEDWSREASFHYARGAAPRIVTHEPRLPDGDYTVQIDLSSDRERSTVTRHVKLAGGATSIELAAAVPR